MENGNIELTRKVEGPQISNFIGKGQSYQQNPENSSKMLVSQILEFPEAA